MRTCGELVGRLGRDGIEHRLVTAGDAWMIIVPSLGARILGAGIGEENALWTAPAFTARGWSEGGNAGGARTWLAPEAGPYGFFFSAESPQWNVPRDLDPGSYREIASDEGALAYRAALVARPADGSAFPLAITRRMRLEEVPTASAPRGGAALVVRFQHELENSGDALLDRRAGLWCIVQVPSDATGTILIPLRDVAHAGSVNPYFAELPPGVLRTSGRTVLVKALGGQKYKIGVPAQAAAGGIAFVRPSRTGGGWILVSLRFPVDPSGTYLDKPSHAAEAAAEARCADGDAVQAYNDAATGDMAFSEIEAHTPAAALGPGERQAFPIDMTIAAAPEREMMEYLRASMTPGVKAEDLFLD